MSTTHQPTSMPGYALPVYPYRTPPELAGGGVQIYPVIVAGGGLGGLAAALELGSRGIRTIVLDEDNTVGAAGLSSRGICYAKRTLEILDRFGIAARIRAKGITWNEGDVYRGDQCLYRFNLQPEADQKFPSFVNLQQFYVEQYLVEKLGEFPTVDLRWKNRIVEVRVHPEQVEVDVDTPDGRYSARGLYLIGADGAHSTVRERIGATDADSGLSEDTWCIADVKMDGATDAVRKAYLDNPLNEGGAIWYHQMADGVWRTDWQIGHYADPDAEAQPARAQERLRKLLGPGVPFELVWVGAWRFRKRYLERMIHGRVLFLGDAAAQHSPFGARGGNRAIQDANNLAWKLALVLEGKADPRLLQSYESERHQAAREAVEIATRSAIFIGPETPGQQLVRDAILDLAERHPPVRAMVNVGRLSVACAYAPGALIAQAHEQRGEFDAPSAAPGCAAPDGTIRHKNGARHFVDRLQGGFAVVYFGTDGPAVEAGVPVGAFSVAREDAPALFARYGVRESATYVFRPDGHVLARCTGIDATFAAHAVEAALGGAGSIEPAVAPANDQLQLDRVFDALAAALDRTPQNELSRLLARVVMQVAGQPGLAATVSEALHIAAPANGAKR